MQKSCVQTSSEGLLVETVIAVVLTVSTSLEAVSRRPRPGSISGLGVTGLWDEGNITCLF